MPAPMMQIFSGELDAFAGKVEFRWLGDVDGRMLFEEVRLKVLSRPLLLLLSPFSSSSLEERDRAWCTRVDRRECCPLEG